MGHWIFVINNTDEEFKKRIESKMWPVYGYTINRKKIQPGDSVVFYKAGEGNKILLGTAKTTSAIQESNGKIDFFVCLDSICIWNKPILMKPMVKKLDFVKDWSQWGRYMQGGVIALNSTDYDVLTKNSS